MIAISKLDTQCFVVVCLLLLLQNLRPTEAALDNPDFPELVVKITRHGARTPVYFPPGDPNNDFWTELPGQLTNEGKNQLYDIGKVFRSDYNEYLNELYKAEEILILSTDVDRTIMSALSFLAGLYPPQDHQIWNTDIPNWQPIPVHLRFGEIDAVAGQALGNLLASCHNGTQDDLFFSQNQDLIELIQTASGIYYTKCLDTTFFMFLDALTVEKFYGRTLPFGLDSHYPEIQKLKDDMMIGLFASPSVASAFCGPVLQYLSTVLEARKNNTLSQKAIPIFMHDTNVLAFLATLTDHFPVASPEFAASISIELFSTTINENEIFTVKVYHIPSPTSPRLLLSIKGCGHICSLDDFLEQLRIASIPQTASGCPCYENR